MNSPIAFSDIHPSVGKANKLYRTYVYYLGNIGVFLKLVPDGGET